MREQDYHNKYREQLEQNAEGAPDDVWNNISSQLDMDASEMRLDDQEQELLDDVWGNLQNELDVDEVWGKIDHTLDKNRKGILFHKYRRGIAAAIILLMVGLTGVMQMLTGETEQTYSAIELSSKEYKGSPDSIAKRDNVINPQMPPITKSAGRNWQDLARSIPNKIVNDSAVVNHQINGRTASADVPNNQGIDNANLLQNEPDVKANELHSPNVESRTLASSPTYTSGSFRIPIDDEALKGKTAFVIQTHDYKLEPTLVLPDNKIVDSDWISAFKATYPIKENDVLAYDRKDSRWTTGVVTSIKNSYLLNAETMDGFSSSGMNESKMTVVPEFGLNVQYAINQRYIFDTNLFFSSTSKQNSNTYKHGEYISKNLQLNYIAGEFALKQNAKHNIFGSEKIIRRNVAGVYVAQLQSASETLVSDAEDVASKYAALDYGIIVGQEFELRSKGPVKVSTGLTVKYGLPNVYTGDNTVPSNFNKTHNASVEFRIGIAYRWSTKVGIDHYLGFFNKRIK